MAREPLWKLSHADFMKTIGMLGGMSPESTRIYYERINRRVRKELGDDHSAKIILYSFDFAPIKRLAHDGEWEKLATELIRAAQSVEKAGADFLLLCTNTVHKVADEVQQALNLPILHIVDVTAAAAKHHGCSCLGLLGTKFTMEGDFYSERLRSKHGIETILPGESDREWLHHVIYDELCRGEISPESQRQCSKILGELKRRGADGLILGCTELSLLRDALELPLPIFDTTELHSEAAADFAMERPRR